MGKMLGGGGREPGIIFSDGNHGERGRQRERQGEEIGGAILNEVWGAGEHSRKLVLPCFFFLCHIMISIASVRKYATAWVAFAATYLP